MRSLFGCLAVLLGAVSIGLAARYGYKGADTEIDGVINGCVFGLIALCAFLFDAAAVRLWFMRHRIGSCAIGLIAAAALVVTFTNSLGAIAGRADTTQAERSRAKDDAAADRAELARITKERTALAAFAPATDEDVAAARDAVTLAERVRLAECDKRGPRCRERESEEKAKRDHLSAVLANKALTVKAAKLDADAHAVRARLAKAPKVQHANPLGAVLEQLIGATAAALTAWQQAVVAGVFELCLVGVMVIFELLGHAHASAPAATTSRAAQVSEAPARAQTTMQSRSGRNGVGVAAPVRGRTPFQGAKGNARAMVERIERMAQTVRAVLAPVAQKPVSTVPASPTEPRPPSNRPPPVSAEGSVRTFALECLSPAEGEVADMKDLLLAYRGWCQRQGLEAKGLAEFAEDMRVVCDKAGIAIEPKGKRVLCHDIRLAASA